MILKPFSRTRSWRDTTPSELKQFLGLTILMGLVDKPSLYEYWTTNTLTETPIFGETMPRDRYFNLLSFIHVADNELMLPRGDVGYDPLFKIRPLYDAFRDRFSQVYVPDEDISIDEGMVPWKGRLSFRQYIPNKPDRFGVKLYIMCESKSGYMCSFNIYTGSDFDPNPDAEHEVGFGHSLDSNQVADYYSSNTL